MSREYFVVMLLVFYMAPLIFAFCFSVYLINKKCELVADCPRRYLSVVAFFAIAVIQPFIYGLTFSYLGIIGVAIINTIWVLGFTFSAPIKKWQAFIFASIPAAILTGLFSYYYLQWYADDSKAGEQHEAALTRYENNMRALMSADRYVVPKGLDSASPFMDAVTLPLPGLHDAVNIPAPQGYLAMPTVVPDKYGRIHLTFFNPNSSDLFLVMLEEGFRYDQEKSSHEHADDIGWNDTPFRKAVYNTFYRYDAMHNQLSGWIDSIVFPATSQGTESWKKKRWEVTHKNYKAWIKKDSALTQYTDSIVLRSFAGGITYAYPQEPRTTQFTLFAGAITAGRREYNIAIIDGLGKIPPGGMLPLAWLNKFCESNKPASEILIDDGSAMTMATPETFSKSNANSHAPFHSLSYSPRNVPLADGQSLRIPWPRDFTGDVDTFMGGEILCIAMANVNGSDATIVLRQNNCALTPEEGLKWRKHCLGKEDERQAEMLLLGQAFGRNMADAKANTIQDNKQSTILSSHKTGKTGNNNIESLYWGCLLSQGRNYNFYIRVRTRSTDANDALIVSWLNRFADGDE